MRFYITSMLPVGGGENFLFLGMCSIFIYNDHQEAAFDWFHLIYDSSDICRRDSFLWGTNCLPGIELLAVNVSFKFLVF